MICFLTIKNLYMQMYVFMRRIHPNIDFYFIVDGKVTEYDNASTERNGL